MQRVKEHLLLLHAQRVAQIAVHAFCSTKRTQLQPNIKTKKKITISQHQYKKFKAKIGAKSTFIIVYLLTQQAHCALLNTISQQLASTLLVWGKAGDVRNNLSHQKGTLTRSTLSPRRPLSQRPLCQVVSSGHADRERLVCLRHTSCTKPKRRTTTRTNTAVTETKSATPTLLLPQTIMAVLTAAVPSSTEANPYLLSKLL